MTVIKCSYDTDNPKVWTLEEEFNITIEDIETSIPVGFRWDGASVPRWLWWLIPRWGRFSAAALVHDWYHVKETIPKSKADWIFLVQMKKDGVSFLRRNAMFIAVSVFGSYDKNAGE